VRFLPQLCLITSSCNSDTLKSSVFSILKRCFYSTFFRARQPLSRKKIEIISGSIRRPQRKIFTFAVLKSMRKTVLRRAQNCFQARQKLRPAQSTKPPRRFNTRASFKNHSKKNIYKQYKYEDKYNKKSGK